MSEKPALPERCSQAEYARLRGWSTAYVSKLRGQGRLVLDDRGLVIVKSTNVLVDAMRHPTRGGDRTGKHARAAAAAAENGTPSPAGAGPASPVAGEALSLTELTRLERIERIRKFRLESAEAAGQLVRRDAVEAETFKRTRQAQEALMALKDRLVPLLALEADEHAIDLLLDGEFRHVIAALAGNTDTALLEEAA